MAERKQWFGYVPERWKVQRIKTLFSLRDERNYQALENVNLISLYTNKGVMQHSDIEQITGNKARNADGYKKVYCGDIIVNILLCWMGAIGYSAYEGVTSPAYDVYKPIADLNSVYYHYLFRTKHFSGECYKSGKGIMMMRWRTYSTQFMNILVPVPPRAEQDQIVRFLDWKVSEINKLIGIKRKKIKELENFKLRYITDVITKGLNNNVQMQNSSSKWTGCIPAHWKLVSVRRAYSVILGKMLSPKKESPSDSLEEYVCAKDVHFDGVSLIDLKKMWFSPFERKQYCICDGDLLVVEGGAGAGNASIVHKNIEKDIYVQNSVHVIRAKDEMAINGYLAFWLFSLVKRGYMESVCSVATIPHYTKDKVLSTIMPLPPLSEQRTIVEYLEKFCRQIDIEIMGIESSTKELKELKSRLISDVVTGKIDVRNMEVPAYEHIDDVAGDGDGEENVEENVGAEETEA